MYMNEKDKLLGKNKRENRSRIYPFLFSGGKIWKGLNLTTARK